MLHTPNEMMSIGRRVFAHEITKEKVAREYSFSIQNVYKTLTNAKNITIKITSMNTLY